MPDAPENFVYGSWFNGVDYSLPADELNPNTLYACENIRIGNAGQSDKRNGTDNVNVAALTGATSSITGMGKQRFSATSSETWAISGAKFWADLDDAVAPDDKTGACTISAGDDYVWSSADAGGTLIASNGKSGDTIIKWTAAANDAAALDVDSRFTWAKWVEWFDRRAWFANLSSGVNRVWRSDSDDIETYGALNFYTFDYESTGIKKWQSTSLAVHTLNGISLLSYTGDANVPYRKQDIIVGEENLGGTISGRSIVNVPGMGQAFVRREGIFMLTNDQQVVKISAKLDGARYWDTINKDRLAYSFAVVYSARDEVWFWLPYGASQTKMNHCVIFNYRMSQERGTYVWYGPDVDLTRNCGALFEDYPHFGGFDGFVYKHNTGATDYINGTTAQALDAYFETGMPPPYGGAVDVRWSKVRVFFEVAGNHDVEFQENSLDVQSRVENINMGGTYDAIETSFTIGVSRIAGDDEVTYADINLQGTSPFKRLRFRNGNSAQAFSIRKAIASFTPVGNVRRDKAGAY